VFSNGRTLMWEYPRATPEGDKMDFAEVMDIRDSLIGRHRVYWGWFGRPDADEWQSQPIERGIRGPAKRGHTRHVADPDGRWSAIGASC
jgi:hypothetical protein